MEASSITSVEIDLWFPEHTVDLAGFCPPRGWDLSGEAMKASLLLIALDNGEVLVFGSIDTLFLDSEFHDDLLAKLGHNYHLYLVASHTHNAPSLARSVPLLGKVDEDWYSNVLVQIAEGIKTPPEHKITEIGQGSEDTELVINRRLDAYQLDYKQLKQGKFHLSKKVAMAPNGHGEIDKKIKTVFFKCAQGKIRTVVWSLAAHPVFALSYRSMSADFPGQVRSALKQSFGENVVSIFLPGLAGSAIPRCKSKFFLSRSLSEHIIRFMPFNKSIPPFDKANYKDWSQQVCDVVLRLCDKSEWVGIEGLLFRHVESQPLTIFKDRKRGEFDVTFRALAIGKQIRFVLMNGEPLGEWTSILTSVTPADQFTVFSGYSSGTCLYIPPEAEIRRGGYEVERFQPFFGLNGLFVGNINKMFAKTIKTILNQLAT